MSLTERIRPIHSEELYERYLHEAEDLCRDGSPEAQERAEVLIVLLNDYESRRFPMLPPDPIEAIKYCMERRGLKAKDLQRYIGPRQHVHDVLHGKRQLSKSMIRRLHDGLGIPFETLLGAMDSPQRPP